MAADSKNSYIEKSLECSIDGQTIRGVAFVPDGPGKKALIIASHGFGATNARTIPYCRALAPLGLATYAYDFRGGGLESKSDGKTTDMSVMTEARDLQAVLTQARTWDFVDPDRIVLLGFSQGGMVSAIVASRVPDEVFGLILVYPAFCIRDDRHREYKSLDDLPETRVIEGHGNVRVGRRYITDIWNYDVYADLPKYTKPVLILHGDLDKVVPLRYSEEAEKTYPDAVLHVLPGAGHGFNDEQREKALVYIKQYLGQIGILGQDS